MTRSVRKNAIYELSVYSSMVTESMLRKDFTGIGRASYIAYVIMKYYNRFLSSLNNKLSIRVLRKSIRVSKHSLRICNCLSNTYNHFFRVFISNNVANIKNVTNILRIHRKTRYTPIFPFLEM